LKKIAKLSKFMKNFRINYLFLWISGLVGFSSLLPNSQAVEKIYFTTSDGEKFWCDRDNLRARWDKNGELARLCSFISNDVMESGTNEETPLELDFNGRLLKEYVLDLIRDGEVSFKDRADAENTLRICEKLGLAEAEEFICKHLKRKSRRELAKKETGLKGSQVSRAHSQIGDCPEGYLFIPGNESYPTPTQGEDFCVMKYAASQGEGNNAVSRQGTLPWVGINRNDAATACSANGEDYHLITNSEWMAIARNIEGNDVNWNQGDGPVGQGTLSRGNSNSTGALAPGSDESSLATDWINRRTHTLSTGELIWDMAGNVWQWVSDPLILAGQSRWQEMSILNDTGHRHLLGPRGGFTSAQGIGKIVPGSTGAVLRGGAWSAETIAGIFAAALDYSATYSYSSSLGFRCAAAVGTR
jgi:formylglycine-generating enzyme required for sulfatase activity